MSRYNSNFIEIKQIDRDSINYLIRNLENFEKNKAVKSGLGAAGNVFKVGGKSRLRQRMKSGSRGVTGNLLGSFDVRVAKKKPMAFTGFKKGGAHSHLVDKGTKERFYITKTGKRKSVGRVQGNYFWHDTEAQDYPKAMSELYNGIEKGVNRINSRR